MERTAMQELQRRLFDVRVKQNPITLDEMNDFIEKEKQQIKDAYWDGGQDIPLTEERCEEYYKETFKQD